MLLQVKKFAQAQSCLLPMGVTSENVAHRFGVSRQEQDQAAVRELSLFSVVVVLIFDLPMLTDQVILLGRLAQKGSCCYCCW